jgi:hypothetical protein
MLGIAVLIAEVTILEGDLRDDNGVLISLHFFLMAGNVGIAFRTNNPFKRRLTLYACSVVLIYLLVAGGQVIGIAIDSSFPPIDADGISERGVLIAALLGFLGLLAFWWRFAPEVGHE